MFNDHIYALANQGYGYMLPIWEAYNETPVPSDTEISTHIWPVNTNECRTFRAHYVDDSSTINWA